jgi:uncharacterized protein YcaQ
MSGVGTISAREARRVVLAAQGFAERPVAAVDAARLKRLTRRLGVLQIDSVNVLVRAHYLPLFSRLGAYPREALDAAAYDGRRRHLFEYWGHEASLLPVELYPLFRWRMAEAEEGAGVWGGIARIAAEQPAYVSGLLDEIARRGPLAASDLESGGTRGGPWWGWSDGKRALEFLFWSGRLTTATRRGFERVYDLPERVLPRPILALPTPDKPDAIRALVTLAASAFGIATEPDLRDYFRLAPAQSKRAVAELVEAGTLRPVEVAGWRHPAYIHAEARRPRKVTARALLAPFDPLVWNRDRTERLFGCRYRIEIYTPAHKRQHGYYVLPFLLGEDLVARVDLKADRQAGILRVQAAHLESGAKTATVAPALAESLAELAAWLGLGAIEIAGRGDLSPALAADVQLRP